MVDPGRSLAESDGLVFGYLGVRITGQEIWTIGHDAASRRLGPLAGAHAGLTEPPRSGIGMLISSVLLAGDEPPKNARLYVAFADGTSYERLVVPWLRQDWPKVAGQIGRFNAAALFAAPH